MLGAFEQHQREVARAAAEHGRWVEAIWAWDVVLALQPGDGAARSQREAAAAKAASIAADHQARARQARQRGDLDAAVKLYLEALAVMPNDAAAADALREIERSRTRRGSVSAMRTASPMRARAAATGGDRNDLEHASLLAQQGEFESAIALLAPLTKDPRARAQLADIYWRQALSLEARDHAGAVAALQHCLQLEPGHKLATEKLKALKTAGNSG